MDKQNPISADTMAKLSRQTHAAFERWLQDPASEEAEKVYYDLEAEYQQAVILHYRQQPK